jgi:ubiquinone/menaquinone biosynthesis C-methylase UbiE
MKERFKHLSMRLMRPGVTPVQNQIADIQQAVGALAESVGRLNDIDADQNKYDSELEYWRWLIKKGGSEKGFGGPFAQVFGQWTRNKMIKMGEFLGLPPVGEPGNIDDWAAGRSVIEIGAGPYPLIAAAAKGWKRCVAVDPIARGYVEEDLLPPAAQHVVYVAARGESIPLPSLSADMVVIENCLDHVRDPAQVVREITRLLVPGGHLWIFVDLSNHVDHMHPHAMNEKKVRSLLSEEGRLDVVRDEVTSHKAHPEAYGSYCGLLRRPARSAREQTAAQEMRTSHEDVRSVVEVRSELSRNGLASGRPHN